MALKNKQKTRRFKRYIRKQFKKHSDRVMNHLKEININVGFVKSEQEK